MNHQPHADPISTSGWILVIVRDQRLHHLFLLALRQAGYTVLGSTTISEAEPILHEHAPPRLILFDGAAASEKTLQVQVQQLRAFLVAEPPSALLVFTEATPLPRVEHLPGVTEVIPRPFDLRRFLGRVEALF